MTCMWRLLVLGDSIAMYIDYTCDKGMVGKAGVFIIVKCYEGMIDVDFKHVCVALSSSLHLWICKCRFRCSWIGHGFLEVEDGISVSISISKAVFPTFVLPTRSLLRGRCLTMNPLYLLYSLFCFYDHQCDNKSNISTTSTHRIDAIHTDDVLLIQQIQSTVELFKYLISAVDLHNANKAQHTRYDDPHEQPYITTPDPLFNLLPTNKLKRTYASITSVSYLAETGIPQTTSPLAAPPSRKRQGSPLNLDDNCVFLGVALKTCENRSPGFTASPPQQQAECLCYDIKNWIPGVFDLAVDECARFASTAAPLAHEALLALSGFCRKLGDVKGVVIDADASTMMDHNSGSGVGHSSTTSTQDPAVSTTTTSIVWATKPFTTGTIQTNLNSMASTLITDMHESSSPITTSTMISKSASATFRATSFDDLVISTSQLSSPTAPLTSQSFFHSTLIMCSSFRTTSTSLTRLVQPTTTQGAPVPTPTSGIIRTRRMIGEWEIVWVSFCCAMTLLFL